MSKRRNHKWIEKFNPMGNRIGWWCCICGVEHNKFGYPSGKVSPCDPYKEATDSKAGE